ncbi:hypothetical protein ES702_04734 [subsurface metagenome]
MNSLDKNYLSLQFKVQIYSKNGTEFHSFFEDIMEKAFLDYQKIKPYGNKGDGGNDGYRKKDGIYFQVYAPETPKINENNAAKKFRKDFAKLKNEWDEIQKIKAYNFVYNDKYSGSVRALEQTISQLEKENINIIFKLFLAKDLESVFFLLQEADILNLGFNIDTRMAISNADKYLELVEIALDRENTKMAIEILYNSKNIINTLNNEWLSLKYEILECRCLVKLEKIEDALEKYQNIATRFPNDPHALLYLAEIYLNYGDFTKNKKLLEKAKEIDNNHWLLQLEELIRKDHLGEKIVIANVNEDTFPTSSRKKANFYRVYAPFFENSGDKINADRFIAKAIRLNPDRFSNYITKLLLSENRLLIVKDTALLLQKSQKLLEEIEKINNNFSKKGNIGARNKAILNSIKLNVLRLQENFPEFVKTSKESFKLILSCSYDKQIDRILITFLWIVFLPNNDLNQLLKYLKNAKKEISKDLARALIFQFNMRDSLLTEGIKFFEEIKNEKYLSLINDLKYKKHEKVLKFLKNDIPLAEIIASTLKNFPHLRERIIKNLPGNKNIQKEWLLLSLYSDEKNYDKAFEIIKQINLTNLSYYECKPILKIIQENKAWDYAIVILKKLLEKERNEKERFNLTIQLFDAYRNLNKYPEVIETGEQLLQQDLLENILDPKNKETLLAGTVFACLERGKFDTDARKKSQEILEEYQLEQSSLEFRVGIEAEVYLINNKPQKALESVIAGVKIKKILSIEEYANLYFILDIRIGNQIDLNLNSLNQITENTFIKLNSNATWYFIGEGNELDTIKIKKNNDKYSLYINKKAGEKITYTEKYSSASREETIENIFTIEQYILWQAIHNFRILTKDDALTGVTRIDVPEKDGIIDVKYLSEFFRNIHNETEPFFKKYCQNNVPLALLSTIQGGLVNAIGRIQQEKKGFINFSTGTIQELERQKEVARKIIEKESFFYIDGTSALLLSELGLFKKVYNYLPNLKVPQSVINLLINNTERFNYIPGQTGRFGYAQGNITFHFIEKDRLDLIKSNLSISIKLLESKSKNVITISPANKTNCFSEQKIPPELSDACILAQKENLPVLTEDFLYLKMNEVETEKKSPSYFSTFILLKVLYETRKISFIEYLDIFEYLSYYRLRFIPIEPDDIEKAVLGDEKIKVVSPENIKKFNFPLTLSEAYGVPFQSAFNVVASFLSKLLYDNSITSEIMERIFSEIIQSFPTKMVKRNLAQLFLEFCINLEKQNKSMLLLIQRSKFVQNKIDKLKNTIAIFNYGTQL